MFSGNGSTMAKVLPPKRKRDLFVFVCLFFFSFSVLGFMFGVLLFSNNRHPADLASSIILTDFIPFHSFLYL